MTTTSPTFTVRTSAPMASTTPMASWPIRRPMSLCSIVRYGQRSLPQMAARFTATKASVGSARRGSGTFSMRTLPTPYITVARMVAHLPVVSSDVARATQLRVAAPRENVLMGYCQGLPRAAWRRWPCQACPRSEVRCWWPSASRTRSGFPRARRTVTSGDSEAPGRLNVTGQHPNPERLPAFSLPRAGKTALEATGRRDPPRDAGSRGRVRCRRERPSVTPAAIDVTRVRAALARVLRRAAGRLSAGAPARQDEGAVITPYPNGPYLVRGVYRMTDLDGNEIDLPRRTIALCRCGLTGSRPWCDGSHKAVGRL